MSTKILLSILHLSKTLAVILQKEFLFPPYSSKGHRSLCDRDSLIAQFLKDLPMNLIHRQFFDAVWGRMRLRHPERKDCFQTVMGRDMQRALHIFLRASPIGGLTQPSLNPAAAKPQSVRHQMHIGHSNRAILHPYIGFLCIGKYNNCTIRVLQHLCRPYPAFG